MEFGQIERPDTGFEAVKETAGEVAAPDGVTIEKGEEDDVGSGSDSEDEWYRQMEAAALGDDKEGLSEQSNDHLISNREFKNETDYFDEMQNQVNSAGAESSLVSPEEDPIWQTIIRDMVRLSGSTASQNNAGVVLKQQQQAAQGRLLKVGIASKTDLMLLEQFLFSHLPLSSKTYFLVHTLLKGETGAAETSSSRFETWTDDVMHPSIVIVIDCLSAPDVCVFSILPPDIEVLESLRSLLDTKVAIWKSASSTSTSTATAATAGSKDGNSAGSYSGSINEAVIKFGAVDARLWGYISSIVGRAPSYSTVYDIDGMGMYTLEDYKVTLSTVRNLPDGFILTDLSLGDCSYINERWEYRNSTSMSMIERCVAGFPCKGIRNIETGLLVSWSITYDYGAIGMTYTDPEFRGKGFARIVAAAILDRWVKQGYGCAPFVYIHDSNTASLKVFTSLGFGKCNYATWTGLK